MIDVTDIASELKRILSPLVDVDQSSLDNYVPMATTQTAALLIVPFQQVGQMDYAGVGVQSYVHAHDIPCEFWVKVQNANVAAAMERGRDLPLQAMRLLAANPQLNGISGATLAGASVKIGSTLNGAAGRIGRYTIAPRYEERGVVTYIIATLFVNVEIREIAAW